MPLGMLGMGALSLGGRLGGGLLQHLFGGQKSGYQMSPDEKRLSDVLWKEYEGDVPGHVTAPFVQQAKGIKQHFKRMPGSSAQESAVLRRQAFTPMAEAGTRHKKGLLAQIMALTKGTGTQTASSGAPWGDIIGGGAEDIGFLWALQQMMGGRGQGQGVMV